MSKERILELIRGKSQTVKEITNILKDINENQVRVYLNRLLKDSLVYIAGHRGREKIFAVSQNFCKNLISSGKEFSSYPYFDEDYCACQWATQFYGKDLPYFLNQESLTSLEISRFGPFPDPIETRFHIIPKALLECPQIPTIKITTESSPDDYKHEVSCEFYLTKCPGIYYGEHNDGGWCSFFLSRIIPTKTPNSPSILWGPIRELDPPRGKLTEPVDLGSLFGLEFAGTSIKEIPFPDEEQGGFHLRFIAFDENIEEWGSYHFVLDRETNERYIFIVENFEEQYTGYPISYDQSEKIRTGQDPRILLHKHDSRSSIKQYTITRPEFSKLFTRIPAVNMI